MRTLSLSHSPFVCLKANIKWIKITIIVSYKFVDWVDSAEWFFESVMYYNSVSAEAPVIWKLSNAGWLRQLPDGNSFKAIDWNIFIRLLHVTCASLYMYSLLQRWSILRVNVLRSSPQKDVSGSGIVSLSPYAICQSRHMDQLRLKKIQKLTLSID